MLKECAEFTWPITKKLCYFQYLDRRCVTESECYNISKPLDVEKRDITSPFPFRPILDLCTLKCPANFSEFEIKTEFGTRFQCLPCNGPCKKECPGGSINSISSAQKFAGCTHIKGSLEIHLRFAGEWKSTKSVHIEMWRRGGRKKDIFFSLKFLVKGAKLDFKWNAVMIFFFYFFPWTGKNNQIESVTGWTKVINYNIFNYNAQIKWRKIKKKKNK